jgi:glycosyltransferase involved in cell wall biosynthesis
VCYIAATPETTKMNVAIIQDWLNGMRGGERVLEALLELYPEATIYTLFHEPGTVSARIESHRIVTSWMNRVPGVYSQYRNMLPLFPAAIESFDLTGFDLILSSSHAVAKGVQAGNATHICYCHTPMRYIWDAESDYAFDPARRFILARCRKWLRNWDCASAKRVDHFIANSEFVRERVREYYGRQADVIHPPIDTSFFSPASEVKRQNFYLAAGALASYKKFDLVVQAFNALKLPLVIAGKGPESLRLRRMSDSNVDFRGWVTDEELRRLYRSARGFVVAAREDFGMTVVEAQACGCPVIAFDGGGYAETVRDGINGVLFADQQVVDIIDAVRRFESMTWPAEQVRQHVEAFSRELFKTKIREFVVQRTGKPAERLAGMLQPA